MNQDEFKRVIDAALEAADWEGDNAIQGLKIIEKYMPTSTLICGADHDIIYSVDIDELIDAGITLEDVKALGNLNWGDLEGAGCMACYV